MSNQEGAAHRFKQKIPTLPPKLHASREIKEERKKRPPLNPFHSLNPLHLPISRRPERPPQQLRAINRDQADGADSHDPPDKAPAPNIGEIEVIAEKGDGAEVDGHGGRDAGGHDPVPGDDLAGDHDELVEDEDGEGDGDHARGVFVLIVGGAAGDQELGEPLDDDALVEGNEQPDAKGAVAERRPWGEVAVEFRVEVGEALVDVAVEHEGEDGRHGVHGRVADEQPVAVEGVGLEVRRDAVHRLARADDEPAVHDELRQLGRPLVAVAPVPHQQLRQVVEGSDAEVRR